MIDDNTDLENIHGKGVGDMKAEIRRSLQEHGIHLFAYIFLVTPSEPEEEANEEL